VSAAITKLFLEHNNQAALIDKTLKAMGLTDSQITAIKAVSFT
jgi:hypothetical protein